MNEKDIDVSDGFDVIDYDRRLSERLEAAAAKRAAMRALRATLERRRRYGLAQRHTAKIERMDDGRKDE